MLCVHGRRDPFILPALSHSSLNGKGQATSSSILILQCSLSWVLGSQPLTPSLKTPSVSLLKTTLLKKAPGGLQVEPIIAGHLICSAQPQPLNNGSASSCRHLSCPFLPFPTPWIGLLLSLPLPLALLWVPKVPPLLYPTVSSSFQAHSSCCLFQEAFTKGLSLFE